MLKKIEYLLKHNSFIQRMYIIVFSSLFRIVGVFVKQNRKQVLFSSLIGKNYGDSPKALFDAMKEDPFFKDYSYVWAFDNPSHYMVEGADKVKLNSAKYFITALKSGIWISNVNIERGLHFKPRNTIYLNTWHGCAPLKVDGNAQRSRSDYNFSDVDILCSNSDWQDDRFVIDYNARRESIIRCGMPRNDTLYEVSSESIRKLKNKYKIPTEKKVILYAPTWREATKNGEDCLIAPPIDIDYWKEELAENYIVLFRMHHLTNKALNIKFDDFVRDYSGNYDINDLMKMADILITDYSSTLADYAILERPTLLFAYDYEEYYNTRGLYMRLEDLLPGYICTNEGDLINMIKTLNYEEGCNAIKKFKENYVQGNKHSTEKCLKELKNRIVHN